MKYLQTFEKLGINNSVDNFSKYIWNLLNTKYKDKLETKFEFEIPVQDVPKEFTTNMGRDIQLVKFTIFLNMKRDLSMTVGFKDDDSDEIIAILYFNPVEGLSALSHDIQHMFQYLKNYNFTTNEFDFKELKPKTIFYKMLDSKYDVNHLADIMISFYLCFNEEIDARVIQCFNQLKEMGTFRGNFYQNLKRSQVYSLIDSIDSSFNNAMSVIMKNPIKYYNQVIEVINSDTLYQLDNADSFKEKLQEFLNSKRFFEEIEDFVNQRKEKFRRKLLKLYDHF